MNAIEPIADLVTGSVAARVGEPATGVDPTGHTTERACLNCAAPLVGDYCHACGQRGHVHRSLGAFGHDLLHGVFHFEGKIWRTLPMLAFRPGALTRRYIAGERARFVSPLALFLFTVFLMFALFSAFGKSDDWVKTGQGKDRTSIADASTKADAKVQTLRRERQAALAARRPVAALDQQIKNAAQEARILRDMRDKGVVKGAAARIEGDLPFGLNQLSDSYREAFKNTDLLLYKLQTSAYKYSWALIPISLPFVWLLFLHRRRYRQRYHAYDHVVFVTYSLVFMSLVTVLLELLLTLNAPKPLFQAILLFVPPAHMLVHLKGAYELSWGSALWRLPLLLGFAWMSLMLFGIALLALGVL